MNFLSFLQYHAYSAQGLVRPNNEDSFLALPEDGFFAVMDGMGGGDAGEVAAQIIHKMLTKYLTKTAHKSQEERKHCVQQALYKAHALILGYAEKHHYDCMGSTVVSILFNPWNLSQAQVCHLGDSRLYCLRNGERFCLTQDHTVGNELLQNNQTFDDLSPELLYLLTRVVGSGDFCPQWSEITVCPDDIFMLCSDGVWGMLDDATIKTIMSSSRDPLVITELLEQHILAAGADDNYTILPIVIGSFNTAP